MVMLNTFWTHNYRVKGAFRAEGRERGPPRVRALGPSGTTLHSHSAPPAQWGVDDQLESQNIKVNKTLFGDNDVLSGADNGDDDSNDEDEYCGIDIVTSEPIRGKDCRMMEMRGLAKTEECGSEVNLGEVQNEVYSTQRSIQPMFWDRLGGESGANLPAHMVRPYYRSTPIRAELERWQSDCKTAQILFLDEGGELRAILGAALLRHMLNRLRTKLDVEVDWASLGPPTGTGWADPKVKALASAMGVCPPHLASQDCRAHVRQFEDIRDAVKYDLILVMDRFDYQEVLREVAVLDTINPGGHYADRVKLIGPFAWAAKSRGIKSSSHGYSNKRDGYATALERFTDVPDPSYEWQTEAWKETEALQQTAKILARACRGVASFLIDVECGRKRVCRSGVPNFLHFRDALRQALCCPLINCDFVQVNPSILHKNKNHSPSITDCRGARNKTSKSNGSAEVTVRKVGGRRKIVKWPAKSRGYWKDMVHVDAELLKYIRHMNLERLPTQKELRANGASSLASAIDTHGGLAIFSSRLGIPLASRKPNGYWNDFKVLQQELKSYIGNNNLSRCEPAQSYKESMMPLILQNLRKDGRNDILGAIQLHGGSKRVAKKLGLCAEAEGGEGRSVRYKAMVEGVVERLQAWMRQVGVIDRFPTFLELIEHGRRDLASDVARCGGGKRLARRLGVAWFETRGPKPKSLERTLEKGSLQINVMEEEELREELDLLDCYEEFVFL